MFANRHARFALALSLGLALAGAAVPAAAATAQKALRETGQNLVRVLPLLVASVKWLAYK